MTPFDPGYWYFWPVTSMTLAVVTAVHLYGRARSNDYRARTALGLAGAGVLTVSIPFAALATSVDIEC